MPTAILDKPIEPVKESAPAAGPTDPAKPPGPADEPAVSAADASDRVPATAPVRPPIQQRQHGTVTCGSAADKAHGRPIRRRRPTRPRPKTHPLPGLYKLRMAPNHAKLAQGHGGGPETEAAVQAALHWLADNQNADGRWIARQHEAGRESWSMARTAAMPASRPTRAMTGLGDVGLSRLGPYASRRPSHRDRSAADWNTCSSIQAADGNLAGQADVFARMYSHAMAAFALSEAYGMTGDTAASRRRPPGDRLHRRRPGSLRRRLALSAGRSRRHQPTRLATDGPEEAPNWPAFPIPEATRQGIIRFLRSVCLGQPRRPGILSAPASRPPAP